MQGDLRVITAPTFEPVTLAEVKAHLNLDSSDWDTLLGNLITMGREHLDHVTRGWMNLALCTQTLELVLDTFPIGSIKLPHPPIQSVTSIKYDDTDGTEQTFAASNYTLSAVDDLKPGLIVLKNSASWPVTYQNYRNASSSLNAVRVRYVAGWAQGGSPTAALTPWPIKRGLLQIIADAWVQREGFVNGTITSIVKHSAMVDNLLEPFRAFELG